MRTNEITWAEWLWGACYEFDPDHFGPDALPLRGPDALRELAAAFLEKFPPLGETDEQDYGLEGVRRLCPMVLWELEMIPPSSPPLS
jgi:hypothetical protein